MSAEFFRRWKELRANWLAGVIGVALMLVIAHTVGSSLAGSFGPLSIATLLGVFFSVNGASSQIVSLKSEGVLQRYLRLGGGMDILLIVLAVDFLFALPFGVLVVFMRSAAGGSWDSAGWALVFFVVSYLIVVPVSAVLSALALFSTGKGWIAPFSSAVGIGFFVALNQLLLPTAGLLGVEGFLTGHPTEMTNLLWGVLAGWTVTAILSVFVMRLLVVWWQQGGDIEYR